MTHYYEIIKDGQSTYWKGDNNHAHRLLEIAGQSLIRPLGTKKPRNIPATDIKEF